MVSDFTSFDATSSFVGYLYQVRYALLLALKKLMMLMIRTTVSFP